MGTHCGSLGGLERDAGVDRGYRVQQSHARAGRDSGRKHRVRQTSVHRREARVGGGGWRGLGSLGRTPGSLGAKGLA